MNDIKDILVIGGGINGVGIARDAAGRGLTVTLIERDDLAAHTSSASTKLIHGGLRYLEYYEFRLVREALKERECLLHIAPHIIWPLTFILPEGPESRAGWKLRAGLWLYDHLAPRQSLPASRALRFARHPAGGILADNIRRGFSYSDCWVEDSRLVVLNAIDARERGAEIRLHTSLSKAAVVDGVWHAEIETASGQRETLLARILVNAAGPWVGEILGTALGLHTHKSVRKVKGSHIIVPRLYDEDFAFILQNPDGRIIFVIPYEGSFSLIGTTDIPYDGDPAQVQISPEETAYLCSSASRYLRKTIVPADVVRSYSGVRPLYDDHAANASAVTRDYVLNLEKGPGAPVLSVFGGKITTYRRLAEHALQLLEPALGKAAGQPWTATAPLPGGDLPGADFDRFLHQLLSQYAEFPATLLRRYARAYGTRAERILAGHQRPEELGEDLGGGLYEAEVQYLVAHEWANTLEDILWRRSKLSLHVPSGTEQRLRQYLEKALSKR
ncbi:glycerol-3-phosphate dehydrogenase [Acidithiobacillus sp. CV18-2]|uniref:Glycerol-3-phosphate dehydrogenase n=1 Tax=Igneacidithiobacillus copahuensis TaxID=2724909 RepID=A0AAE2YNU5_9PROT|nr:glycerol-3-phosphate dehydrogenase [Igneacidithiobacillus copahuensis]MBU2754568.1 glycerol-3-phosphate dehydrogenase [Acidithiobacillus sp. CV18-3]MBU2757270.1 glycerol-3-phosphate dehydrogenase [Acidithiobacillus sp. BN09-2]MBU2776839.1 glycerol-3-phosphate dehydrogenase [Acidithiobacillus sp. CV18-2]MBU2796413.1 glycerol-3-phosphate dehydrogenase [Acidithiobacillus sp. VAN18-2]MBU2799431.1 glycerol-3-phosphate dehydrogenase [Acidithiobacillus sp. VAN18-4]UTV81059.1 glycerol-3-phosphate 